MLHFFWILHYWEACSETVDFLEKFGGGQRQCETFSKIYLFWSVRASRLI